MGRIDSKRCTFADRISFADRVSVALGDRFAIGFSHPNTVGFTTSIRFTGCIPFSNRVSDPVASGVAETGRLAGRIPFAIRGLGKPGFSLDARCFANARRAKPTKKTTATSRA